MMGKAFRNIKTLILESCVISQVFVTLCNLYNFQAVHCSYIFIQLKSGAVSCTETESADVCKWQKRWGQPAPDIHGRHKRILSFTYMYTTRSARVGEHHLRQGRYVPSLPKARVVINDLKGMDGIHGNLEC